jgi:carboxymethylenebutenolidase
MTRQVDYYFVLNSPWSFLANTQLPEILKRTQAQITLKPVHLPSIFEVSGGLPLAKRPPQRQAYRLQELARWSKRLQVPLNLQPAHFPVDERLAAAVVLAAQEDGHDGLELATDFGAALWVQEHNLADEAVISEILSASGLPSLLIDEAKDARFAAMIEQNTQDAIAAGVFGVPSFVVGDQLFWGQDRLDFVEEALRAG